MYGLWETTRAISAAAELLVLPVERQQKKWSAGDDATGAGTFMLAN